MRCPRCFFAPWEAPHERPPGFTLAAAKRAAAAALADGPSTATRLASGVCSRTTMYAALALLEQEGLVKRSEQVATELRRPLIFKLTAAGRRQVAK